MTRLMRKLFDLDAADLYEWNEFLRRLPDKELIEIVLERIPGMEEELLGSLHAACGHELLDRDYRKSIARTRERERG